MNQIIEEVGMGSQLIVPRFFWFELDTLAKIFILGIVLRNGSLNILMSALCLLGSLHENIGTGTYIVLDNITKHLYVEPSGAIALSDSGIDVAAIVELICEAKLRQQLTETS